MTELAKRRRALIGGGAKRTYLYISGNQCTALTGGWQNTGFIKTATGIYATLYENYIEIGKNRDNLTSYAQTISTVNKIDLQKFQTINIKLKTYQNLATSPTINKWFYFPSTLNTSNNQSEAFGADYAQNRLYIGIGFNASLTTVQIPLGNVRREAYVCLNVDAYGQPLQGYTQVHEIWLE